jgi:Protein of unknown function (DUF3025)
VASGDCLNTPLRRAAGARCTGIDPAVLGVADIDWTRPWLADWRGVGETIAQQVAAGTPQPQALTQASRAPVRFVPQADLPAGMAYEAFIGETAQVPTREGLHDFFNALCWMHFPQAKRQLNRLQSAEIARAGVGQVRGPVRDACTVFDENAVLIQAPDSVWQALTEHRWHDALVAQRAQWAAIRVWVFGHAALEKLVQPYKSITVHLWRVPEGIAEASLDDWLAHDLQADKLATKPFSPLPVLGVPGWWPANADPAFYDDTQVFRPPRRRGLPRPVAEKPQTGVEMPSSA